MPPSEKAMAAIQNWTNGSGIRLAAAKIRGDGATSRKRSCLTMAALGTSWTASTHASASATTAPRPWTASPASLHPLPTCPLLQPALPHPWRESPRPAIPTHKGSQPPTSTAGVSASSVTPPFSSLVLARPSSTTLPVVLQTVRGAGGFLVQILLPAHTLVYGLESMRTT